MEEKVLLFSEGAYWANIQALAQNAVVQVLAQVSRFNWLEPYKVEAQYETRGSGFFINKDGYFITNVHVVNDAKRVWIHMPAVGRHPLLAQVVSLCPERDLALLRLQPEALELVRGKMGGISYFGLGDSDKILRTESVLALGYPLGQYRLKSTTGVVSGMEVMDSRFLIQITAPVNPGNSGGPLLNTKGEVVGIAIASIMDAQNIGYAIPINELHMVLDDMYTQQLVRKPMLGVRFVYSDDEKARFLNNPLPSGLYVSAVIKDSLLEKAGVRPGDMLYEFNGFLIDAYGEARVSWSPDKIPLFDLINRIKPGQTVHMVMYRQGTRHDIQFVFELKSPLSIRAMFPGYEPIEYEVIGGLVIMPLTDNHIPLLMSIEPDILRYRWPENKSDPVLVITHILPGSYAHQVHVLSPGSVIEQVNGLRVTTLDSFREALHKSVVTGLLTIQADHNELAVFSLDRLLADEEHLSRDFVYPVSPTVHRLFQAFKGGKA